MMRVCWDSTSLPLGLQTVPLSSLDDRSQVDAFARMGGAL